MSELGEGGEDDVGGQGGPSSIKIIAGSVGVVIVAFIVLLATRDPQQNDASDEPVGAGSPPVVGVSYDGVEFDLDDVLAANQTRVVADQEWVVLNFFASWCIPCRQEHPELVRLDEQGAPCPSRLVGVAVSDAASDVEAFFDDLGGDWPVLVGNTSSIIIDFSVVAPPETLVIAPSGLVVAKFVGAVTYDRIVEVLEC